MDILHNREAYLAGMPYVAEALGLGRDYVPTPLPTVKAWRANRPPIGTPAYADWAATAPVEAQRVVQFTDIGANAVRMEVLLP